MSRIQRLLSRLDPNQIGVEIAPYFNGALPKRDGHRVLIMDLFDADTLRSHAANNPLIEKHRIQDIEEVDFVGDAGQIGEMIKGAGLQEKIHFIVSSHNFEHLPNPIGFLQGAFDALAMGGVLSMAIPDYRACFDHFRYPSRLSDWLRAHHEGITQPDPELLFDSDTNLAF